MTVVFMWYHTLCCELVFLYTTVMGEPDIPQKERTSLPLCSINTCRLLIGFTILLLVFTAAMGMVHVRFKQLHVLLATVRLDAHDKDINLEDFSIMGEQGCFDCI